MSERKLSIFLIFLLLVLSACSDNKKDFAKSEEKSHIVIWTNCTEFAQYIELFNKTHQQDDAVLVYKENPALSLMTVKAEETPDIIVGPWLRSDSMGKDFLCLDYLFYRNQLSSEIFYSKLLESGKVRDRQYLLPVSFNLPAVIFSSENRANISDNYTLTLDQIRSIGSAFNEKNKRGFYTRIGFAPLMNSDFLYLTSKLLGSAFREEKKSIVWNQDSLDVGVKYLRDWVINENGSASEEKDFSFKYLFMPDYRQITSGRTLFAYTVSNKLFNMMNKQDIQLDYRWICNDRKIPMEDSFTLMGIYKNAANLAGASEFLIWFFQAENQHEMIAKKISFHLNTEQFGIADGFSAVKEVTERILPTYYTQLLSNLPPASMISVPEKLPARWNGFKTAVLEQYIESAVCAEEGSSVPTMKELEAEWEKKIFD